MPSSAIVIAPTAPAGASVVGTLDDVAPVKAYVVGTLDDVAPVKAYVVGTLDDGRLVLHLASGEAVPAKAEVVFDGSSAWTWTQLAKLRPDVAAVSSPHEWAGEATSSGLTPAVLASYKPTPAAPTSSAP